MANLPDFSYTLWDWASGNETCPPDPSNPDAADCHVYKTHVGWLNSNHFLPMAEPWYQHLHGIALERAAECRAAYDAFGDPGQRARFQDWLLACEREALAIEGAAQHYLQDAWSVGHMWERWGGARTTDFGGDRTLGFAISAFSGLIHGAKSIAEGFLPPWLPGDPVIDDPMCAPSDAVTYVEPLSPAIQHGAGDVFADHVLYDLYPLGGGAYDPQRDAMLGCAVDGLRAVYEATAQAHGPLASPDVSQFDPSRRVSDASCWSQRATNTALATGCGLHVGAAPNQTPLVGGLVGQILAFALSHVEVFGLPMLAPARAAAFQRDAAYACSLAQAAARMPGLPPTWAASGNLPSLAGVRPNSSYLQGGASTLPASYADPFLPWNLDEPDPAVREKKEALALTFLDAHAAERCGELSGPELQAYVNDATEATLHGEPPEVAEARCGLCARMVAPHLRFGMDGDHDPNREAFCAYVNPAAAFLYTGDDPSSLAGADASLASLFDAAYKRCGCCAEGKYTLTRLDPSGGADGSIAVAINDAGQIALEAYPDVYRWNPRPTDRTQGTRQPLALLPENTHGSLDDINSAGAIAGSTSSSTLRTQTAVVWNDAAPQTVGLAGQYSAAFAIDDGGAVAGSTIGVGGWLVAGGVTTPLGGAAQAMNGLGALAGSADFPNLFVYSRPALWPSATSAPLFLGDFGAQGYAADLSDAGVVVGTARTASRYPRPFRSEGSGLTALPKTTGLREDGEAFAVNERGDIVGMLWTENQDEVLGQRAVLWANGVAVDLNERIPAADVAKFVLAEAEDINERGQIVGWGVDLPFDPFDYTERAFLLTPRCGD